jgi:hypothetical protein
MYSTHEANLALPALPSTATHVHIVPDMNDGILLSIGQFCDAGCEAVFTATTITIKLNGETIMTGTREGPHKLWHMDLPTVKHSPPPPPPPPMEAEANALQQDSASPKNTVAFMHAALFSPAVSTLTKALDKGYIHHFPGLNSSTIRKYPPFSTATVKGHQDHIRKNMRSTKPSTASEPCTSLEEDTFPVDNQKGERTHFCFAAVHEISGQIFTDQTGPFVLPSSSGNKYIMILYDYDSNAILAEPIPSRSGESIIKAFKVLHSKLVKAGLVPKLQ